MSLATVHATIPTPEAAPFGRNRLLADLPAADFSSLASYMTDAVLDKGTVLQEPGEPISRVYFPHSGLVSLLGVLPDGNAVDAATIGREGAIGLSIGLGSTIAVSRAVVQLQARVAQINALAFAEIAARSAAISQMIARYNDTLLAQVQQSVACNALHHVQARLCRWLLHARDRTEADMLPLTQEFLAGILGVQRTTVTIISRTLQADGIIHVRRGRIQILDARALEGKACACYGAIRHLTASARRI
jgi:CRP-like cAMP-binding protein